MRFTAKQLRELLNTVELEVDPATIVSSGELISSDGKVAKFDIVLSDGLYETVICDRQWKNFQQQNLLFLRKQNLTEEQLEIEFRKPIFSDSHWEWLSKNIKYDGSEYSWFFMIADNVPQGACLIYHPRASVISSRKLFYIEYLAAAPWNRDNFIVDKKYSSIGKTLLKAVFNYATSGLGLDPGFSLHSLPTAEGFYVNIGLTPIAGYEKDKLRYFETPVAFAL